ncbi:MAG: Trk system potassium transporter TrkA [Proteobacteria bacterium]|nr:Trk system potassium transporter TrkA [Pseudomonadota bacterium]MBU4389406.1 Trk system potassium transporter TrkA [Pseudomonadota bacterium]MCG2830518.1 Trk system potassium transporter TrkA [Desulfobacteraceae bacterium]
MFEKKTPHENILILGLGGMGYYLAKRLVHEGYPITVIESNSALTRYADGDIDARLIQGNAMSIECWREANSEKMDCLIAVTDNDAVNMLSSMIADRFGIQRKIVRVRSLEFGNKDSLLKADDLKIDLMIHPEELTAQEIVRLIKLRAGNDIIDISGGQIQLMATRIREESPLAYKKLKEISHIHRDFPFRVVAVARGITTIIPGGEHEILPQDQVYIMVGSDNLPRLMELTDVRQQRRHRVMILGGGLLGSRVAELLEKTVEVKLIEKDEKCAQELSFRLKNVEVLHGDGSDTNVLVKAGLFDMDTFITATGDNETNIMSCLLAKHLMNTKITNEQDRHTKSIALVNKEEYLVLAATMGADIALDKKILAGNEILKFIRRGELLSVAHLHGFEAEVVELVAAPGSPITRKPLSKMDSSYYGKIMIGSIFRDGEWKVAVGDTHIHANERVIVVCTSPHLKDVQELFLA